MSKQGSVQFNVRLSASLVERLDAVVSYLEQHTTQPDYGRVTRSSAARDMMIRGIMALEKQLADSRKIKMARTPKPPAPTQSPQVSVPSVQPARIIADEDADWSDVQ
ncbi:MAG: hypothetical protein H7838_07970 [Magnetococcus sp. DMHC-8]